MAVNYSIPELLKVLRGNDMDLVSDAFRRFPIISKLLVESDAVDSKLTDKFVVMVPDYVNARKANKTLIENLYASGDTDDGGNEYDDEQAEKPVEEVRPEKKAHEKKNELEPEQEDDEEDDKETEEVDYNSMKAMDLYKLCQKRGIEAEPKHRTKYYITLLEKADQEAETPAESSNDDDDDWDI